jgi:Tfp pilus assembly protein PilN
MAMQQSATLRPPAFIDLNVLPEELRPPRYPAWYIPGLVAVALLGLLLVPLSGVERANSAEPTRLTAELELISKELTQIEMDYGKGRDIRNQLGVAEEAIARLAEERQAILGGSQQLSTDLYSALQVLPPGTHLVSMTATEGKITLTGQAAGQADVLAYYRALADSGKFSQSRITSMDVAVGPPGAGAVAFAIEVTQ